MSGDLATAEVRLLGVLEVLTEGLPVELRTAKVRAVLAMLALHPGQVLSAERLAEGLWGDTPPASAANTLQGYISQLRRVLGRDAIVTRAPGYLLALPAEAVDVGCFERLVTEGRAALDAGRAIDAAALLESALALWRGSALDEFTYEPFAQAEAARLEELRLVAVEELVDARLALGRHTELVGELRPSRRLETMESRRASMGARRRVRPGANVRERPEPVDEGVGAEVDEDDLSAQIIRRERLGIEPAGRPIEAGQMGLSHAEERHLAPPPTASSPPLTPATVRTERLSAA